MLFRRKRIKTLTELGPLNEVAWDDETVKRIAQNDHLNVKVTHITKTISLGQRDCSRLAIEHTGKVTA